MPQYSFDNTVDQLLRDPKPRAVFQQHVPALLHHPMLGMVRQQPLKHLIPFAKSFGISPQTIRTIEQDLKRIE